MIVVRDTETLKGKRLVATIGFFDGVHLGHRFLIHELKQVAEAAGLPSAVITFPEHPRAVLHADYQPKLLNSFEEKLKHLASTGIDYCIVLDFTLELSRLTAKEFITTVLADRLHVDTLLIGWLRAVCNLWRNLRHAGYQSFAIQRRRGGRQFFRNTETPCGMPGGGGGSSADLSLRAEGKYRQRL